MISVLIPAYNADCAALMRALSSQAEKLDTPCEIIVADDCSPDMAIRQKNRLCAQQTGCVYAEMKENIGPSRLRNKLADMAQYDRLLFLDADGLPVHEDFLSKYNAHFLPGGIVCGGFLYPPTNQFPTCPLRYRYGVRVEAKPASERLKNPYARFSGMSFLADKNVFAKVRFNDAMHFGYEDAGFGLMLEAAGVKVTYIDNPAWHLSNDSSAEYLDKVCRSIRNVLLQKDTMTKCVRLLQWHKRLRQMRLDGAMATGFRLSEKALRRNLTGRHPSLHIFALYKLGYICEVARK